MEFFHIFSYKHFFSQFIVFDMKKCFHHFKCKSVDKFNYLKKQVETDFIQL